MSCIERSSSASRSAKPIDIGRRQAHEIGHIDFIGPRLANARRNQLQTTLIDLRRSLDAHQIAVFETAVISIAGVPHPRGNRPGPIGQFHLQIQISIPIRPQLLLRRQKNLIDIFLRSQITDKSTSHNKAF